MEKLKFEDLPLSREIQQAITQMGFEEATPIQSQSIPYILDGKDVIGQALTGTGKTAAFGIPALEMIDPEKRSLQAVILCSTRELAIQVAEELKRLSKFKQGVETLPIYGGQPIERQIKALKKGVQIIIGTPGRVMDHLDRHTLKMGSVRMLVLDEADVMLDMGFREDIEYILKKIPKERQTILFSATMPKAILDLTNRYQNNPQLIKVVHKEMTVPSVEQFYFEVKTQDKLEVLTRLIDTHDLKLSLVFCNTKRKVDEVVENLEARGYLAEGLHGDMNQSQRDQVMSKFRKGTVEILVATDVAARGIDVHDIEAVFNYDLPQDEEYYVHRIGRTARAGRTGQAFTFVVGKEIYKIRDIQQFAKTKIKSRKVPSLGDVEKKKTNLVLEKVRRVHDQGHLGEYVHWLESLLEEGYNSLDVAAALLKICLGEGIRDGSPQEVEVVSRNRTQQSMVRLCLNVGSEHKVRVKDIVGTIAGETGLPGKAIGAIEIFDRHSFVDVARDHANDIRMAIKDNRIKGNRVNVTLAHRK